jgi:hypothetical protein
MRWLRVIRSFGHELSFRVAGVDPGLAPAPLSDARHGPAMPTATAECPTTPAAERPMPDNADHRLGVAAGVVQGRQGRTRPTARLPSYRSQGETIT